MEIKIKIIIKDVEDWTVFEYSEEDIQKHKSFGLPIFNQNSGSGNK